MNQADLNLTSHFMGNEFKANWYVETNAAVDSSSRDLRFERTRKFLSVLPGNSKRTRKKDDGTDAIRLRRATQGTARAVSMGLALSAIDGPLPVMDLVAFTGVTIYSAVTWIDYFTN